MKSKGEKNLSFESCGVENWNTSVRIKLQPIRLNYMLELSSETRWWICRAQTFYAVVKNKANCKLEETFISWLQTQRRNLAAVLWCYWPSTASSQLFIKLIFMIAITVINVQAKLYKKRCRGLYNDFQAFPTLSKFLHRTQAAEEKFVTQDNKFWLTAAIWQLSLSGLLTFVVSRRMQINVCSITPLKTPYELSTFIYFN